ncbi:G kinase-anchoring protein 1-like isoform X2 [Nilaparvata lugens]|uniref:G kinase-anchoring protein 1-like isoform X2 n=1 Tax=Nilaparvata lugens TaxID=108931 RepID=UPI00193EB6E7|nr:G kinase-anchoring protein 1-like isoform X2 [Nilaparvata lugens]
MALAVNSRFAVLSVDDDGDVKKSSKKKTNTTSTQKTDAKKKEVKKPSSAKAQPSTGNQSTNKNKTTKTNKKKANADEKQWELWKQKDEEMVNGNYETELHEAILLSQLDYEKKKDVYAAAAAQAKEEENNNKNIMKKEKEKKQKKNKPITMSLNEFNNRLEPTPPESGGKGDASNAGNAVEEADPQFFDRVKEDAKKVLNHEKQVEKRKAREPFVDQEIALARLEERLERKEKEVTSLQEEVTRLKEELKTVRARNRDLCLIMSQGEMKDKAEVIVAMERTTMVKDELSGEVERLHALLEQERSKVRALSQHNDKNKTKGKKRTASENN